METVIPQCYSVIAPSSAPPPPPQASTSWSTAAQALVAIRTQPNLPQLAGALNMFQATLCLSSASFAALCVDIDVLTFLQRASACGAVAAQRVVSVLQ